MRARGIVWYVVGFEDGGKGSDGDIAVGMFLDCEVFGVVGGQGGDEGTG